MSNESQPRRLLIIGTTSQRSVLKQLDLIQFNREIPVANVNDYAELAAILREVRVFESEASLAQSLNQLRAAKGTDQVGVGIKKVLLAIEEAKQEVGDVEGRFAEVIAQQIEAREGVTMDEATSADPNRLLPSRDRRMLTDSRYD